MNPVLRKDLLGLLRLKRIAAIQVLFVLVLGVFVLATWPQQGVLEGTISVEGSSAARGQDQLLSGLIIGQIVLLMLFVPGIASVALTGEKEANTLEMLYATRLSPLSIILGKIGLAVSFPILLLLTGLPFVALLNYRGDVRTDELLTCYAILLMTALFLSIVSLAISAACKQSSTALVIAYMTVLVLCGAVLVPAAIMLDSQSGQVAEALHYIRALSPVAAVYSVLMPNSNFGGVSRQMMPLWQVFLPAAGLVTLGALAFLVAKLSKAPTSSEGYGAAGGGDEERSIGRKIMFLLDPKKKRKPVSSFNPIIGNERKTSQLRGGRWMIRIFYGSLFLSLGLAVMALYGGQTQHKNLLAYVVQVLISFQIGVVALVVPSLTSSSVSSEIENGTFEVLRLAPLRAGTIFWGKFIPAFLPALLPVVAMAPAYFAVCFVNPEYISRVERLLPILLLAVAFCAIVGLTVSCFIANTARATVASYLMVTAVFLLPMFAFWAAGAQINERLASWFSFISPLAVSLSLLPDETGALDGLRDKYMLHLYLMGAICLLLLIVARMRLTALLRRG